MTLLQKAERLPPFLVRYLARTPNGRRGLSHEEIARASGLAVSTVRLVSFSMSWRDHTFDTQDRFCRACGVNHLNARHQIEFLKRRKNVHVANATGNQKKMYDRLEELIIKHAQSQARK
jgi:hypothetical protein